MFRSLKIAVVLSFDVVAGANAQIVALGASSTAGYGVGASAAYPAQLQAMLRAKGRPMSVGNAGISGDTTGGSGSNRAATPVCGPRTHKEMNAGGRLQFANWNANPLRVTCI